MNKKNKNHSMKAILILMLTATLLGCIPQTITATTPSIIPIVTIDYHAYQQVNLLGPQNIDLVYITSPMNQSDVTLQNLGFVPANNWTRYLITSNTIQATPMMKNTTIDYLYQDPLTLQLYSITINYTSMSIPESSLAINYTLLLQEYDALNKSYENLTANLSFLQEEYTNLNASYYQVNTSLNETALKLQSRDHTIDIMKGNIMNLSLERNNWWNKYNESSGALLADRANMTALENFYTGIKGSSNLYFPSDLSKTAIRQMIEKEMKENNGKAQAHDGIMFMLPWYIICTAILSVMITLIICYIKWYKTRKISELEQESEHGYGPLQKYFDKTYNEGRRRQTKTDTNDNPSSFLTPYKAFILTIMTIGGIGLILMAANINMLAGIFLIGIAILLFFYKQIGNAITSKTTGQHQEKPQQEPPPDTPPKPVQAEKQQDSQSTSKPSKTATTADINQPKNKVEEMRQYLDTLSEKNRNHIMYH